MAYKKRGRSMDGMMKKDMMKKDMMHKGMMDKAVMGRHSPKEGMGNFAGRMNGDEEGEMQGGMAGVTQMGKSYYGAGTGDFANMPREVCMEMYPRQNYGVGVDYPDTYEQINECQGGNERHMQSQRSKDMY